jgi:hypothetical protein
VTAAGMFCASQISKVCNRMRSNWSLVVGECWKNGHTQWCGKGMGFEWGVDKCMRVPRSIYKYLYYCNVCTSLCSMEGIISMTFKIVLKL